MLFILSLAAIPISLADSKSFKIPNVYLWLLLLGLAPFIAVNGLGSISRLVSTFLIVLTLHLCGMGMGDVKLLISLNGWLAWHDGWLVLIALAIGLIGANVFAIAIWIKKKDPKEQIALGPFLLLGFCLAAFAPSWRILTAVGESLA